MSWLAGTSWPGRSASMMSSARSLAPPISSASPEAARTSSDPSIATCTCSILPDSQGGRVLRQPAAPGAGTPMGLG